MEVGWEIQLNLGPIVIFKDQLNEALEPYTSGQARDIVDACGEESALDAWRQMSDKWCSMRLAHLQTLMKKALFPRTNVPVKELKRGYCEMRNRHRLLPTGDGRDLSELISQIAS